MKVKLGDYRVQFIALQKLLEKENPKDICVFITTFAASYHTPIIVVAHYIVEMIGMKPEIQNQIEYITKFYGYTSIVE